MKTIRIPGTQLDVSTLCLGTADFGASVDEATAFALLDRFTAAGGTFLDTARIYADWTPAGKGSSERLLARWLQRRGSTRGLVIATKGGHPELGSMHEPRLDPASLRADLDASRRDLGLDTIDLWYLHRDDRSRPVGDILASLEDLVSLGHLRHYAFSNWRVDRAEAARTTARAAGAAGFVAGQCLWSLAVPDMSATDGTLAHVDDAFAAWHEAHGVPAIPYSSQANGLFHKLLSGRTDSLQPWSARMYPLPANEHRARRVGELCARTGLTVTQVVLGFLRGQSFPVIPIVGPKSIAQVDDCLAASDTILTTEEISFLLS